MTIEEAQIEGDRGRSPVSGGSHLSARVRRRAVIITIIAFAAFLAWSLLAGSDQELKDDRHTRLIRQTIPFEPAAPDPEPESQPRPPVAEPVMPQVQLPQPRVVGPPVATDEDDELLKSAQRAPVLAFSQASSNSRSQMTSQGGAATGAEPGWSMQPASGQASGEGSTELATRLQATPVEMAQASRLPNRNLLIAMGTSLPCVLETALSSDQPGYASCVIPRDILSDNGHVVLMERGTQVTGEYRSDLSPGKNRLFVLWTRAKTPTGVVITLASPATDALGRSGFDGHIDTHWWERFGSALLLSVVGDASAFARRELSDSNADATVTSASDAASIAVEQSINIAPTLRKNQGEAVSSFVARDLDFSSVYTLALVKGQPRQRNFHQSTAAGARHHLAR